ncbi:MAG: DUF1810 domain-containing protein [Nitrospirota bacterium]
MKNHDNDPFQLHRFITAQENIYDNVLQELRNGKKQSHWMWFIFPQIEGLAQSTTSNYYAIKSIQEAEHYLNHPILGMRLIECSELVLVVEGKSISQIFGHPDDIKFKSCMTLFACVEGSNSLFIKVLDKYFNGEQDSKTIALLKHTVL